MNIPENNNKAQEDDRNTTDENYQLKDAADNNGIVPDDALQKVNPAAAERLTEDYDPHNVAKDHKHYDSGVTKSNK